MARRRRRNKGSVHPMLRSTYGNRARKLKDGILSLLPPPPDRCQCGGVRCLRCRGADHLLCPGDPTTYRHLISYAHCAVSSDAPAPPVEYSVRQLSQRQIVRNTMELMKRTRSSKNNMLCKSYDTHSRTSLSGELLSSSDWSLLLDRIGDLLMEHLLRHYSIFVPNGRSIKGFIQVTGTPLTSLHISKPSLAPSAPVPLLLHQQAGCTQTPSHVSSRAHLKRERDEIIKESSISKPHKRKRLHSWQRRKQRKLDFENRACSQHVKGKDSTDCFRCFMLHSAQNVPVDVPIKRQFVFYNGWSSQTLFPKRLSPSITSCLDILNLLKPNDSGAFSLIKNIFGNDKDNINFLQCTHCGNSARSRSKCLYHSSLALFKSLIRDAQRCRHRMLLQKHCYVNSLNRDDQFGPKVQKRSLPTTKLHQNKNKTKFSITNKDQTFETTSENSKSSESPFSPQSFSKHQQVVSFIFASLRRIVPPPLLGNKRSWRALRRNIYKFVRLQRHEKFFLKDCLEGLEVSNFEFLLNLGKPCSCDGGGGKRRVLVKKLLSMWVYWLFFHVIVPIISSNFYATEKESKRHEVFYYKKPIWRSVVKGCIQKLKMQNFSAVGSDLLRNIFRDSRCFGYSRFRFLPKEDCLRPLASLNKPSTLKFLNNKRYQSVNSSLNELHVILKTIKVQYPNLLGSSVFDYNDVYQKLHGFISKVKNGTVIMPEVFIVVADVSKAFDSIDQDKILIIMEGIIQSEEYIVGNYRRILSRNNCGYKIPSLGSISWHNEGSYASNPLVQFSSNCGLFVAQAAPKKKKKEYLHRLLYEHVKHNILKIGRDFYEQKVGIAQGSIISSLLCSFYLGHLEETLIQPYLKKLEETGNEQEAPQSLLMRYLDDFIFVSTSEKQALGFLERLRRGFRDYNCYMNCTKFGLNFEVESSKLFTNKRYVGEDGIPFLPWSGLLVNCITLEIQADYTRYWDVEIRSTITVQRSKRADDLRIKLFSYMIPKSYVILYDSSINSPEIVRLNAYQAFLLSAMKFHCYISEMHHHSLPSPHQLLKIIENTCRYMYNLICKRVRDAETCFGICAVFLLKIKEIFWLGLFAFIRILEKKQSRHKNLLLLLREKISKYDMWARMSNHLQYAVDDSHSSMFWKIKY